MTDKLRIGIIGIGSRGTHSFGRMLAKRNDAGVAALMDVNSTRMRKATEDLGLSDCPCYTSLSEMFDRETLDGVVITTPDYCHEACAVEAMSRKINVLIDKPLAITSRGCHNVIESARKNNVQAMVGFNLRCLPLMIKVKEIVASGEIGRVMMIENVEFYDGGRTYMARWNRNLKWSGGLWVHKGTHDFDLLNWFNADGTPARVSAFAGLNALKPEALPFAVEADKAVGPACSVCAYADTCPDCAKSSQGPGLFDEEAVQEDGYRRDLCMYLSDKDTHDNGITIVEYDNNVRASHSECFVANFSDRQYTMVGDRGVLTFRTSEPETITLRPRWKRGYTTEIKVPPPPPGGHGGADPGVLGRFLQTIRTGEPQLASLRDGIRAVAVGEAAEISWREHRMVDISSLVDLKDATIEEAG